LAIVRRRAAPASIEAGQWRCGVARPGEAGAHGGTAQGYACAATDEHSSGGLKRQRCNTGGAGTNGKGLGTFGGLPRTYFGGRYGWMRAEEVDPRAGEKARSTSMVACARWADLVGEELSAGREWRSESAGGGGGACRAMVIPPARYRWRARAGDAKQDTEPGKMEYLLDPDF